MAWDDDNNRGPWGRKRSQESSRDKRESGDHDLDELLRKGASSFKKIFNGSGDATPPARFIAVAIILGCLVWASTGFYRINEAEKGLVTRFGKFNRIVDQGLRYRLPAPFEDVKVLNISNIRTFRSDTLRSSRRDQSFRGEDITNMMLTGDENILKVRYSIQWFIKDPVAYTFNDPRPDETVKLAADSAVREIIAQRTMDDARTAGKAQIIKDAKELLQRLLDEYKVGIEVVKINLEEVTPPESVIDAFRDVQRAIADKERTINQARAYQNSIVPVARGKAQQIIQAAEGEKLANINIAQGESARFEAVLIEYQKAPKITEKRLRIQTAERVLANMNKMILGGQGNGVVPYLPLNELRASPSQKKVKASQLERAKMEVSRQAQQQAAE